MVEQLPILINHSALVAINKPHGLLVHRTKIAKDATEFALQLLRDQLHQYVYPVHRLDRKTSGVLLFAKTEEDSRGIQKLFAERKVRKIYKALVRGYTMDKGRIDYELSNGKKLQTAVTDYQTLLRFEIPVPHQQFSTSRYSLLQVHPITGRTHQIRRHLAHIRHPIIGDRPHGCNKQNRLWKEHFGLSKMLLHAEQIQFTYKNEDFMISAPLSNTFTEVLNTLESIQILQ